MEGIEGTMRVCICVCLRMQVSRAGIIFVSETELGWEPVVKSWLQRRDATESSLMEPLFAKYVQRMLDYIRINLKPVMYNEQVSQHALSSSNIAYSNIAPTRAYCHIVHTRIRA